MDFENLRESLQDWLYVGVIAIIAVLALILLSFLVMSSGQAKMLEQPFLGGAFNNPILFGVQIYFWLMVFAVILIVGSELFWRVSFWEPLKPFHGLWKAWRDHSKASFVSDIHLNWDLLSESAAKTIFDPDYYKFAFRKMSAWVRFRAWLFKPDFSMQIAKKLEGNADESSIVTIGRIPTDLIIDIDHWTDSDSKERKEIGRVVSVWNELYPYDQIHTLGKYIKYAKMGLAGDESKKMLAIEGVRLTVSIPWVRIYGAFPLVRSDSAWGGFVRQLAEDIRNAEGTNLNRWAMYVLIFGAGICIMMFASKFFFPK